MIIQLDGGDSSSDDDDVDDDDDDDEGADAEDGGEGEEEPLNSEDDDSDGEEEANLFEMDNVVVCQYDKVCYNLVLSINNIQQQHSHNAIYGRNKQKYYMPYAISYCYH